jgi:enediyne biosynthesis protein E4
MNSDATTTNDDEIDSETEERDDAVIGRALRWSLATLLLGGAAVGAVVYFAWPAPAVEETRETALAEVAVRDAPTMAVPRVEFTDVTEAAGIEFVHQNAAHGEKLLPETMGGGCAFFDFDNDGDQDLLLVNGLSHWPWDEDAAEGSEATMALYRNDGTGKFDDVTDGSGLDVSMYGMGVAVGDYDNDGRVDVFLTAVGLNRLFHNEGAGKFADVTETAGVGGVANQWSTSTGWLDYDNDGDLDLFVCNYLTWSRDYDMGQNFQLTGGGRAYGRPQNFEGALPYLYRNDGNGNFVDVSKEAGLQMRNPNTDVPMAKSLGVVFEDVDRDGWIDIIVANDTVQNFLFHNESGGKFREIGAFTGIAFDMNGNARGAMGIDAARFRDDDSLGVAIANFANEMTALYVTYGDLMQFMDEAISTGIGPNSRLELKFGLFFWDYDLDGRLDMFTANGHLEEDINRVQPSQHYAQPPHLFWNSGAGQTTEFVPVTADYCGPDLMKPIVGRGAAYADVDNDGDLDALITGIAERPRLLRNDQRQPHHWLRLKLTGVASNRDAIGAVVTLEVKDRVLRRQVSPTRSYLSQVELPVTFGLGAETEVRRATILWPDGSSQDVEIAEVDRLYEVTQSAEAPAATVPLAGNDQLVWHLEESR